MVCQLREGLPIELIGEDARFSPLAQETALVRISRDESYREVRSLTCTSHRIHYKTNDNVLAIRLDSVSSFETRGGLLKSKKIVLLLVNGGTHHEVSLRLTDKARFDSLVAVLSDVIREKAWLKSGGLIPKPVLGGIARVVARIEERSSNQGILLDAGLSDLDSLRANARELKELINSLMMSSNSNEASGIASLLREYGLFDTSSATGFTRVEGSMMEESRLSAIVNSALRSAGGVILIHDLFCLVNRTLKLEKIFSPLQFLDHIARIPSVQVVIVNGYRVVVSLNLEELNEKVCSFLKEEDGLSEGDISSKLEIANLVVLHLLLLKVEETYGRVVRDQTDEETSWYINVF